MITLLKPIGVIYAFVWFLMWTPDVNCIKTDTIELKGHKKNAILKPLDIGVLKKIGQHYNKATINDVILGLVSVAM